MEPGGTTLVTGASRGLGRDIAVEMAGRGFDVLAGVRDPVTTAPFPPVPEGAGSLRVVRLDVTALEEFDPPADLAVLVNNAGHRGAYLPVEETPLDQWRTTFETNVFGLAELCRRVIPGMREARRGVICNISSTGAFSAMPFYGVYRASKAALHVLSETLRVELAPFGIRVIDVPIGGVDTDMFRDSIARRPAEAVSFEAYRPMAERLQQFTSGTVATPYPPAEAARRVVDAVLDDAGPLLRPCDPMAEDALARAGATTGEDRLRSILDAFGQR